MRLFSYVVTTDKGYTPNPFWGYCTCAASTPNHQGCRLTGTQGDWLLGNSSADAGKPRRVIYVMQLTESPMDF